MWISCIFRGLVRDWWFYIAILYFLVIICYDSVNCSICKQMLIKNFGLFVNFTGANFHFLSGQHNCKPDPGARNCSFASPPRYLKMQTERRFQTRMWRWQNTIFGFLRAQLDFLAIFSTAPYFGPKFQKPAQSERHWICHNLSKIHYLSVFWRNITPQE